MSKCQSVNQSGNKKSYLAHCLSVSVATHTSDVHISRCRTRSTGASWCQARCRCRRRSVCPFYRRRRKTSCAAGSCAARPTCKSARRYHSNAPFYITSLCKRSNMYYIPLFLDPIFWPHIWRFVAQLWEFSPPLTFLYASETEERKKKQKHQTTVNTLTMKVVLYYITIQ